MENTPLTPTPKPGLGFPPNPTPDSSSGSDPATRPAPAASRREPGADGSRSFPEWVAEGVRIVLIRPQGAGNIGSVARAMANFGLSDLALVAPRADPLSLEARAMACSAQGILEQCRVVDTLVEAVAGCLWVCGTTARVGERRRPELTPRDIGGLVYQKKPAALVFGPEDAGLPGEELDRCHAILTIPTSSRLQSLNLAQAVGVVAYEIWMAGLEREESVDRVDGVDQVDPVDGVDRSELSGASDQSDQSDKSDQSDRSDRPHGSHASHTSQNSHSSHNSHSRVFPGFHQSHPPIPSPLASPGPSPVSFPPDPSPFATADELEAALAHLHTALQAVGFFRQTNPDHPNRDLRRFLARARPTRHELAMIRGMCRKTLNALRYGPPEPR